MKNIKTIFVSIVIVGLMGQCKSDDDISIDEDISSEYSVYSAILKQGFPNIKKPLIVQQTSDSKTSIAFHENVYEDRLAPEDIGKEVFVELVLKNNSVDELEDKFAISPRKVQLITRSDLDAAFSVNGTYLGWDEFYKRYPDSGGYIYFSKVGFDSNKAKALVEYGYVFGGLGAEGGFVYLEREGGVWVLKTFVLVWLS